MKTPLSRQILRSSVAFVVLMALILASRCCLLAAEGDTLQQKLGEAAPHILRRLRERKCHNIGVLKFRVEDPGGSLRDDVGSLNMLLAERLEGALALAIPQSAVPSVRLARAASLKAAEIPSASHLNAAGRRRLFSQAYPPAWGDEPIRVDAFVTGRARFANDYKSLELTILAVRAQGPGVEPLVAPLKVSTDASILHEHGASFHLRNVPGRPELADPAAVAQRVRQAPQDEFPLVRDPSVMLRIFYDGQPVDLEFREGAAWIPEPRRGQKVELELERLDAGDAALGVVVKVNGENTLYRQRLRDASCRKWILTREKPKGTIVGFSVPGGEEVEEFRIASRAESRAREIDYGPDVGTISMAVFVERRAVAEEEYVASRSALLASVDAAAVLQAEFPSEAPADLPALQQHLRRAARDIVQTRGMLLPGRKVQQRLEPGEREWHPDPIMSAVIHYYRADEGH